MSTDIVAKDKAEVMTANEPITPMQMLQMAVEQGADLDKMQKLMDLQERWEANEARKAYVKAMNDFKADPPELFKNKHVSFDTQKGRTEYDHATLDHVSSVIGTALAKHGLSHRWDVQQLDAGIIKVTCVITHDLGHSERVPMQASPDQSGGKNNIQAIGSTTTYLQRYTLLSATGLAVKGMDDDGAGSEQVEKISEEQELNIVALIEEVGANKQAFCKYFKINDVESLAAQAYDDAIRMLEQKRKQK